MKKMTDVEFLMAVLKCTEDEAYFYLEELDAMGQEGFEEVYDVELDFSKKATTAEDELLDGDRKFIEMELNDLKDSIIADFYAVGDDF